MAVLKDGTKGKDVEALQKSLNQLGVKPKLDVDGIFGPKTKKAVVWFQKKANLKGDGVVGPKTSAAIQFGGALPEMTVTDKSGKAKQMEAQQMFNAKYTLLLSVIGKSATALSTALDAEVPKARDMVIKNNPLWETLIRTYADIAKTQKDFDAIVLKDPKRAQAMVADCEKMEKEVAGLLSKIEKNTAPLEKSLKTIVDQINSTSKELGKYAKDLNKHIG